MSMADEITRIRLTRDAIGPDVMLMLDMNAPYDVANCIRFAHAVAPYDICWLEEPLFWHLQPTDFMRLANASPIPLAHGEREWTRFTVRDFIDSGALKFVQFDSTRHAGFTESLRIAHYAKMNGVLIAPHSATHFHAHLVSTLKSTGNLRNRSATTRKVIISPVVQAGLASMPLRRYSNGQIQQRIGTGS
ncbi:MAG: enolase C-terminal domain-like protein [Alphaproteobacteria bacterium]